VNWPTVEALATLAPLPAGYQFAPIDLVGLPKLIAALEPWYPEISVGLNSCYLREDFYRDRVCLDGGVDRNIYASKIMFAGKLVGFWSFEREVDSLAIYGRLIVVAPAHREARLTAHAMAGTENLGRAMGAAFMYAFATLKHAYAQQALERAGFRLLGFFPGRDREEIAPGIVKRVYQAVYAKMLVAADKVHWPESKNMTPKTRALFELLFPDHL
jgi:hypothetical protein